MKTNRSIEQAIKDALYKNRVLVRYQPILNLKIPEMVSYEVEIQIEGPEQNLISQLDMEFAGVDPSLRYQVDRWLVTQAVNDLKRLRSRFPMSRIFLPLTAASVTDDEFPSWVIRQIKLQSAVGSGLVFCVRLSEIFRDVKAAYRNLRQLRKNQIEICLSRFPDKPKAFELIKYLHPKYISPAASLALADPASIDRFSANARAQKVQVLLTGINDELSVDLHWAGNADLIQGNYIQGLMDDFRFDFVSRDVMAPAMMPDNAG